MEMLAGYASSGDEDQHRTSNLISVALVNSAPEVAVSLPMTTTHLAPNVKTLELNRPVGSTLAPVLGPKNPYQRNSSIQVGNGREIVTGVVERTSMDDFCFDETYHAQQHANHVDPLYQRAPKRKSKHNETIVDIGDESEHGIWAPQKNNNLFWVASDIEKGTITDAQKELLAANEAKKAKRRTTTEEDEELDFDRLIERKIAHLLPPRLQPGQTAVEPK
jgi:pre-mRNA-processing factor 17